MGLYFLAGLSFLSAITAQPDPAAAQAVTQEWVARYNGPGSSSDTVTDMTVDKDGNVYVTGYSIGSDRSRDYATIKYDAHGNQLWAAGYNGPGTSRENSSDLALALAVDGMGNVYVTGILQAYVNANEYATIKYDADGNQLWVSRFPGPVDVINFSIDLAVDHDGNVYTTSGSANLNRTRDEYATVKYDADGNQLWAARYNGGGRDDRPYRLAVDSEGNAYVTGRSTPFDDGYVTIKYDANGNQSWIARSRTSNLGDRPHSIKVDNAGYVYVLGRNITFKYDAAGNELWSAPYGGTANALEVDGIGNVYVTGEVAVYANGTTNHDYATIKYDPNGNELWIVRYNEPENLDDRAAALAVDGEGNVYVTGSSGYYAFHYDYTYYPYYDYATIKYDADGNQLWTARYNGPADSSNLASVIQVDGRGNVYVAGSSASRVDDYATVKYRQNHSPTADSISPMNSTTTVRTAQSFTAVYSDPDGWQDIAAANLYLSGNGGMHNEWLHYLVGPNLFTMMGSNDSCSPGQAKTLSNGFLTLDCATSNASGSGNTLTVIYHATPQLSSAGTQYNIVSAASDQTGGSHAIFAGTWNVQ
jgi:hypothetical protein